MLIKILGLDFETQDDKPKTTRITEIGASLYEVDVELNTWRKVSGFSQLCWEPDYPPQTQKIVELTGITDEMLKKDGISRREAFVKKLLPLVGVSDIIMAHKTAFDATILIETCKLLALPVPTGKELLCTLTNFDWPAKYTCRKLSHLAYEHSILVDPASLHRAENDVDLMVRLVSEKYHIKMVLEFARTPWVYLHADILGPWVGRGGDGGVQKEIATSVGFSWESVKGTDFPTWPKKWVGRVKSPRLEELKTKVAESVSPFRVNIIEGLS